MISIPLNLYVSAPGSIFPKQVREVSDYICMNFLWDLDSIEVWRAERRAFPGSHEPWKGDPFLLLWVVTANFPSRNDWSSPSLKPTRPYVTKSKKLKLFVRAETEHISVKVYTATFLHHFLYQNELQIFSIKVSRSVQSRQALFGLGDVSVLFHITSFCSKLWLLGHRGSAITELLFKELRLQEWRSKTFADWQEAMGLFYFN